MTTPLEPAGAPQDPPPLRRASDRADVRTLTRLQSEMRAFKGEIRALLAILYALHGPQIVRSLAEAPQVAHAALAWIGALR